MIEGEPVKLIVDDLEVGGAPANLGRFSSDTELNLSMIKMNLDELEKKLLSFGIGGMAEEFNMVLVRAFSSRLSSSNSVKQLMNRHVKGMVLHGPPGTGKTLLARFMAALLDAKLKVISGPEIVERFVGNTSKNLREIFAEAQLEFANKGEKSKLYIFVFDEIDSIAQRRGSSTDPERDSIVNQFLTLIDGFEGINNIFVIGTTNRRELIDPALLRSGRLEMQLKIGLPNEEARYKIIKVHTKKFMDINILKVDEDFFQEIAKQTEGWSGADIGSYVQLAFSKASFPDSGLFNTGITELTADHFKQAMDELQPKIERNLLEELQKRVFRKFGAFDKFFDFVKNFQIENLTSGIQTCLILGPGGSGKSSVAFQIARTWYENDSAVRRISPEDFVGFSDDQVCQIIHQVFTSARKFERSIVVVDGIEGILHINDVTNAYSTKIAYALMNELKKNTLEGRILFVLGAMNSRMSKISEVMNAFEYHINLPLVQMREALKILKEESLYTGPERRAESILFNRMVPVKSMLAFVKLARSMGGGTSMTKLMQCAEFINLENSVG